MVAAEIVVEMVSAQMVEFSAKFVRNMVMMLASATIGLALCMDLIKLHVQVRIGMDLHSSIIPRLIRLSHSLPGSVHHGQVLPKLEHTQPCCKS